MSDSGIRIKQGQLLAASGVSGDITRAEYTFAAEGNGLTRSYVTTGKSQDVPVLQDVDYMLPRLTIINNGTSSVKWGYRSTSGTSGLTLGAGASVTLDKKIPSKLNIVVNDGGTSGIEIDFFS